jgi:hypothetical protein
MVEPAEPNGWSSARPAAETLLLERQLHFALPPLERPLRGLQQPQEKRKTIRMK